jgi:DNA-binding IclR family transcriptional regulator
MLERMSADALEKHRIPVIDRMMSILELMEARPTGLSIREFVQALKLPRTTVYRILNSLELHGMVRRSGEGDYVLGARLLALSSKVASDILQYNLAAISTPHLQRFTAGTGQSSKISIVDNGSVLVLAAVQGTREYALAVWPGQHLPIHAGAAGKVLLAYMPEDEVEKLVAGDLAGYTGRTLTDRSRLRKELAKIRRTGWAMDKGEYAPSINALAAPVLDRSGHVVAAMSVPFLAGMSPEQVEKLRAAVISSAAMIAADIPDMSRSPAAPAQDQSKKS